jgi:hypothetical protein
VSASAFAVARAAALRHHGAFGRVDLAIAIGVDALELRGAGGEEFIF